MGAGGNSGNSGGNKSKSKNEANVELGLGNDRMSNYGQDEGGTRPENDGGGAERQAKSDVQPKVESQMNAVKPDLVPAGPTEVEMTEDERSLKTKKRGRRSTILTSATGLEEEAQLSRKTLLG